MTTAASSPFVWYELMTTDADAAEAFYREVVGWNVADAGMPGWRYTILSAGEAPVGGLMALTDEMRAAGGRPGWIGYVHSDDVDAQAGRVVEAGGSVHRPAADIPGVGRFAVVGDPHGAPFVLFKGSAGSTPPAPPPDTPGFVGWHELHAGDLDSAFAFYRTQFGWTEAGAVDMGAMGRYQMFAIDGAPAGGMMTKMAEVPKPFWLYYVNVDGIAAAGERVKSAGGQVLHGPLEVPGGNWILNALDPQGAAFALVSRKP